ncbi:hypothetical protein CXB51_008969 [Gossypium anomalum]|uniref:Uncharacterized protein n=1 Tax=Gossypium anomalum TaxID=47600 RepID=A0A8J6DAT9_9ROSI|nr:hypothetical protein CXB51_008969 [Gossypium anomalum]
MAHFNPSALPTSDLSLKRQKKNPLLVKKNEKTNRFPSLRSSKRSLGGQRGWCKAEQRGQASGLDADGALEARGGKRRLGFLLPFFG